MKNNIKSDKKIATFEAFLGRQLERKHLIRVQVQKASNKPKLITKVYGLYRLWNKDKRRIIISCNANFSEDEFKGTSEENKDTLHFPLYDQLEESVVPEINEEEHDSDLRDLIKQQSSQMQTKLEI